MANPRFPTGGVIGANTAEPVPTGLGVSSGISDAPFQLGQVEYGTDNTQWVYGVASGAVPAAVCTFNATTFAITSAAGNHTNATALADGQRGWVRLTAGASA